MTVPATNVGLSSIQTEFGGTIQFHYLNII
jgi:hypothetical protein